MLKHKVDIGNIKYFLLFKKFYTGQYKKFFII